MKRLRSLVFLLVWAGFSSPCVSYAQNTPFQNPSLDSNCYFPQIGDPSEMDTIVGSVPNQELGGSVLKNLGPKPDGSFGNMLIGNISPSVALAQVATGPGFNLHQMKQFVQKITPDDVQGDVGFWRLGHFRDRAHLDIFVGSDAGAWVYGKIFWADDQGNYDTARFTSLVPHIRRGNFTSNRGIGNGPIQPYIAHLTSDTVDDIVTSAYTADVDTVFPYTGYDTAYALLYRGGSQLYGKDTVYEDTSAYLYPGSGKSSDLRYCTQADFRGVGRDDLIVSNFSICTYYRNDPPFSIQNFARAISKDTFFNEPLLAQPSYFPMKALSKNRTDQSVDLLVAGFIDSGSSPVSIYILHGGPNFGSHLLTLDSAAFAITHPNFAFGSSPYEDWPLGIADAGDMTGTGNHVLFTTARNDYGDYWWDVSYVTGKALDNKIDIWNSAPYSVSPGDTLTANGDSLEDYLFSRSWPYAPNGPEGAGSLWLYYGSKNIPVHLDSQWADVKNIPTQNGVAFTLSPNPTRLWSVATIVWPEAEEAGYEVYNLLGEVVQSGTIRMLGGAEQERIYFPNLASGVYEILIHGSSHEARAKLVIVR
ncbi:MAG TPA: hypothetical protein VFH95_04220 [Candidatus Kapabacteria bacterium]|nr:hypothetical protein [Candidatus Kapabacteria bacterium]